MTRRLLPLVLLLLAACAPLVTPPATPLREISGVVDHDLTLAGEVLLSGDLLILAGRTVTLAPGTTLRIRRAESSKIDPEYLSSATEILVRGTLRAEGSAAAPIVLRPELPEEAGEIAWAGIILDRGAATLRQVRISHAEQGVLAINAAPQILDSSFSACRYGIVTQGSGTALLRNNRIESGEAGIFVLRGATPEIVGNRITGQAEEGIFVDVLSRPLLGRNEITGNAIGLVLGDPTLPFERAGISANREDLRLAGGAP